MGVRDFIKRRIKEVVTATPARPAAPARPPLPSAPDAEGFRAVAHADAVTAERPGTFPHGRAAVAVFRVGEALYAVDSACTHEDGPLGEGRLEGPIVTCPYHDWRFDVRTGDCITDLSRPVACFAVRERGGFIWLGARTREGTRERGGDHDDGLQTRTE